MFYTIGEVSKKFNIPTSTLRYYEKEGLLPFIERDKNGIRKFKEENFEWIHTIECLKNTGMPIKDIKNFIDCCIKGDSTINERLETIDNHRKSVIKQIEELNKNLENLNYKYWYYKTAQKYGTCSIHKNINIYEIPKELKNAYLKNKCN